MPNYSNLLASVGVVLKQNLNIPYFGASAVINDDLNGVLKSNPKIGSPAYTAGLDAGDLILRINEKPFPNGQQFDSFIKTLKVGDSLQIEFERFGQPKKTVVVLQADPSYTIFLAEKVGEKISKKISAARKNWLKIK